MAHYAYWEGCETPASAGHCEADDAFDAGWLAGEWGPELTGRYRIPVFWLAGFATENLRKVTATWEEDDSLSSSEDYFVLAAPTSEVVERLKRRRTGMFATLSPVHHSLYDQWIAYVADNYPAAVLIRTLDIFMLDGLEVSGQGLVSCLKAFEPIDRGEPASNLKALQRFSRIDPTAEPLRDRTDPRIVAEEWNGSLAGSSDDGAWTPEPDQTVLAHAAARINKVKPWWAFWR